MTTAPTPVWRIPLFGVGDTIGPLAGVFNSQSNALETALNSLQANAFTFIDTLAHLNLPANAGTKVGQKATVNADPTATNNGDYAWSGSVWVQTRITGSFTPFAIAAGTGTNPAGNFGAVVFPTGRFTVPPLITLQILGGAVAFPLITSVTATGFSGGAFNSGGSAIAGSWNWTAVQMTPTAAAG